ncbi:glycerophosphoryl diester phosphodiesterase membrane domain-containing protein [Paenibacillus marinisediminis]
MSSHHPKKPRFSHTREVLRVWKYAWRPFLSFEIGYKLLTIGVFLPIINIIFNKILDWSGLSAAANHELLRFVFSRYGLFCLVTLAPIVFLLIYIEYAVLIYIAYYGMHGQRARVFAVLQHVISQLPSLLRFGSFGIAVYMMLLLPLLDAGFGASLLPGFSLPNFVTGELVKTSIGLFSLIGATVVIIVLNALAIYALPIMVLERTNRFWPAFRKSRQLLARSKWMLLKALLEWLAIAVLSTIVLIILAIGAILLITMNAEEEQALTLTLGFIISFGVYIVSLFVTPLFISFITLLYNRYTDPADIDLEIREWQLTQWNPRSLIARGFSWRKLSATIGILLMLGIGWILTAESSPWGEAREEFTIMAHRGYVAEGVENTMEAFEGAIRSGAEYIELDILQAADGELVVLHDSNLKRLTGQNVNMYDLTLPELQALTLRQGKFEGTIPSLEEVLTALKGRIKLNIELKTHGQEQDLVPTFIETIRRHQMEQEIIVQSLDYKLVRAVKEEAPDLTVGYVIYATFTDINKFNADFYVIEETLVNARRITSAKISNKPLFVWTVNNPEAIEHYYTLGVDGIITDIPAEAKQIRESLQQIETTVQVGAQ